MRKAEQDFGIKAQVFRPLKGELAEQQRFIEDVMVQGFDGMAISPVNPDSMTPLLDKVAAEDAGHLPRLGRAQVEAQARTSAPTTSRPAAARPAIAALKALGDQQGQGRAVRRPHRHAERDRPPQGIDETLKASPGIEILPVFLDGTDRAKAKKNVEDALARYPDLVLTIGLWSYNGPALADAVRDSTRKESR